MLLYVLSIRYTVHIYTEALEFISKKMQKGIYFVWDLWHYYNHYSINKIQSNGLADHIHANTNHRPAVVFWCCVIDTVHFMKNYVDDLYVVILHTFRPET